MNAAKRISDWKTVGTVHVHRYSVAGTRGTIVYAAYEASAVMGKHSSLMHEPSLGGWIGSLHSRPLTANVEALRGASTERNAACDALHNAWKEESFAAILAAYPEACLGVRMWNREIEFTKDVPESRAERLARLRAIVRDNRAAGREDYAGLQSHEIGTLNGAVARPILSRRHGAVCRGVSRGREARRDRDGAMSVTRYRITFPDGSGVVGAVHGAGGLLDGMPGLKRLWAAARGARHGCYEPKPGHVLVYPDFSAASNGPEYHTEILGARVDLLAHDQH